MIGQFFKTSMKVVLKSLMIISLDSYSDLNISMILYMYHNFSKWLIRCSISKFINRYVNVWNINTWSSVSISAPTGWPLVPCTDSCSLSWKPLWKLYIRLSKKFSSTNNERTKQYWKMKILLFTFNNLKNDFFLN